MLCHSKNANRNVSMSRNIAPGILDSTSTAQSKIRMENDANVYRGRCRIRIGTEFKGDCGVAKRISVIRDWFGISRAVIRIGNLPSFSVHDDAFTTLMFGDSVSRRAEIQHLCGRLEFGQKSKLVEKLTSIYVRLLR